jgi:hypothetical protein
MVNIFKQAINPKTFEEEYLHHIEGDSFGILSKTNRFRILCFKLVESRAFKLLTYMLILASTVNLAL